MKKQFIFFKSTSNQVTSKKLNNKGQGLIEYLMLVALIAVATIGVVKVVGNNLAKKYEAVNVALGADARDSNELKAENAGERALSKKDLSNFLSGARNNGR